MANSEDPYCVVMKLKHDAIIADPQPKGTGQAAVKWLRVTRASASVSQHAFEDAHRGGAVESSDRCLGFLVPLDLRCVWEGHLTNRTNSLYL